MAVAFVNGLNNSNTAPGTTVPVTYTPTAGNMVIIVVGTTTTLSGAFTIVDNHSNSLTANTIITDKAYLFSYIAPASVTGFTITFPSTGPTVNVTLGEYSGASTFGATNTASSGTAQTSGSISVTATMDNSWLISGFSDGTGTFSALTGTLREQAGTASKIGLIDNAGTGAGLTITNLLSFGSSSAWNAFAIEIGTPIIATAGFWGSVGTF